MYDIILGKLVRHILPVSAATKFILFTLCSDTSYSYPCLRLFCKESFRQLPKVLVLILYICLIRILSIFEVYIGTLIQRGTVRLYFE